ncbi:MAG: DUF4230 domain-containing protein [Paludibacteraceae bacterium]|nr:DUF4230 domain-containing protein [Paludibacteraceae bacterium]
MKKKLFTIPFLVLLVLCMVGCSPSQEQSLEARLQTMAETAELGTVEYTVKKIVKSSDKQWYTVGNRKILFQTTAYLKAGIRLQDFSADKVHIDEQNNVTVILPHAQLLSFNMPADEITTVFEDISFFRSRFSADEQNYILQLGEADIRADVPNLGILEDAEKNAKEVFTAMLQQLNYNNINIKFE